MSRKVYVNVNLYTIGLDELTGPLPSLVEWLYNEIASNAGQYTSKLKLKLEREVNQEEPFYIVTATRLETMEEKVERIREKWNRRQVRRNMKQRAREDRRLLFEQLKKEFANEQ